MNRGGVLTAGCALMLGVVVSCGGDAEESFCAVNERLEQTAAVDQLFSGDAGVDEVKASMEAMVKDLNSLRSVAPAQISGEVTLVADGFTSIADYLKNNGYDPASVAEPDFEGVITTFDTPEFQSATEAIDLYAVENCVVGS
jgi:hypothetical protein